MEVININLTVFLILFNHVNFIGIKVIFLVIKILDGYR